MNVSSCTCAWSVQCCVPAPPHMLDLAASLFEILQPHVWSQPAVALRPLKHFHLLQNDVRVKPAH